MDSILELRPLLVRVFNEIEGLHKQIKERDCKIKELEDGIAQLRKENDIYRKVVRMYDGMNDNVNSVEIPISEVNTDMNEESHVKSDDIPESRVKEEEKSQTSKINLSKKGRSVEEVSESRREYHREYRRRRKEEGLKR
jgi:hypothetical protein